MNDGQDLDAEPVRVPEHHKRNGKCGCPAHSQGVCTMCGHLTYVHSKTGVQANLQKPWQYVDVQGAIDGTNTVFTISPVPFDSASVQLRLARQPQEQGIDYTILGGTLTYITPPDESLSGQPHTAQYQ